jgi:hypothetical protein
MNGIVEEWNGGKEGKGVLEYQDWSNGVLEHWSTGLNGREERNDGKGNILWRGDGETVTSYPLFVVRAGTRNPLNHEEHEGHEEEIKC